VPCTQRFLLRCFRDGLLHSGTGVPHPAGDVRRGRMAANESSLISEGLQAHHPESSLFRRFSRHHHPRSIFHITGNYSSPSPVKMPSYGKGEVEVPISTLFSTGSCEYPHLIPSASMVLSLSNASANFQRGLKFYGPRGFLVRGSRAIKYHYINFVVSPKFTQYGTRSYDITSTFSLLALRHPIGVEGNL